MEQMVNFQLVSRLSENGGNLLGNLSTLRWQLVWQIKIQFFKKSNQIELNRTKKLHKRLFQQFVAISLMHRNAHYAPEN